MRALRWKCCVCRGSLKIGRRAWALSTIWGDVALVFRLPHAIGSLKTLLMHEWQRDTAWVWRRNATRLPIRKDKPFFRLPMAARLPVAPPKFYPPRQSQPHRATRRCQTKPVQGRCCYHAVCTRAAPCRFPAIARTNVCCLKRLRGRFAIGCDGRPTSCAKPFGVFRLRGGQSAACGCRGCRGR